MYLCALLDQGSGFCFSIFRIPGTSWVVLAFTLPSIVCFMSTWQDKLSLVKNDSIEAVANRFAILTTPLVRADSMHWYKSFLVQLFILFWNNIKTLSTPWTGCLISEQRLYYPFPFMEMVFMTMSIKNSSNRFPGLTSMFVREGKWLAKNFW